MSKQVSALSALASRPSAQGPINTFRPWQYAFVAIVVLLSLLYSAPNLFPPDHALQISPETADGTVGNDELVAAEQALTTAGIEHFGGEVRERAATIRVRSSSDQLRGREIIQSLFVDSGGRRSHVVALNLAASTPAWLAALGGTPMKYGLDLSGGVHFLLEVDMDKAVGDMIDSVSERWRDRFREEGLRHRGRPTVVGTTVSFAFADEQTRDEARALINRESADFDLVNIDGGSQPRLQMQLKEAVLRERESYAVEQNLRSLRNRVNELGVSEPLVQRLGRARIVVDLPGLQDSADAKRILGKVANLDFRLVANNSTPPGESESYPYEGTSQLLEKASIVSGDSVTDAIADFDPTTSQPQVSITLDGPGGDRMFASTRDNVGRPMAILFKETKTRETVGEATGAAPATFEERRLISVATIQDALGNRFRITGLSLAEAQELSLLLRAGALAAPMYIVEERTVGATLGEANVRQGFIAGLVGVGLVAGCMVLMYRFFGLLSVIALSANIAMLIGLMSLLGVTLTLPGIAGIALTIGMAVDANVLIFSRIREELKERTPQQAIHAGFDRALTTILDSNITTAIVGVMLFLIGSGPVRGFAVVLCIGLATSVFTAIYVTRALVNLIYGGRNLTKLSI